jgi:hypothetical protein
LRNGAINAAADQKLMKLTGWQGSTTPGWANEKHEG